MKKQDPQDSSSRDAGTVYLICFDTPFGHAKHYMGWTRDVGARIAKHRSGHGARLMQLVQKAGIKWRVTRIWRDRCKSYESYLKTHRVKKKICPRCNPNVQNAEPFTLGELLYNDGE